MDVLSMLSFWRYAGGGDPTTIRDFDSSFDEEESFFDLVFTNPGDESDNNCDASPNVSIFSGFQIDGVNFKSSFRFASPDEVYSNNKMNSLPLDSPNTKTPQSPLGALLPGFQTNKWRSEKKETNLEIEEVKIGSLLKRDNSLGHKVRTEKQLDNDQMPSAFLQ
ncbi:hypothetical protein LXL04_002712 [Taraxacum kok-saghyz]